ncbi:MAG: hypothetical protein R3C14_02870 [Caldilineaceae bacterium]
MLACAGALGRPADFPDGIFFVPLLDIGTADQDRAEPALADDPVAGAAILRALAAQIGYKLEAGGSPAVQLQPYLRARRLLLILDNFEHLLMGIAAVVTLLSQASGIKALITSRARLNVRRETVLTLDKLSLPSAAYGASVTTAQTHPAAAIQAKVWQALEFLAGLEPALTGECQCDAALQHYQLCARHIDCLERDDRGFYLATG